MFAGCYRRPSAAALCLAAVLMFILVTGSAGAQDDNPGAAQLRIAHIAPSAGALHPELDGTPIEGDHVWPLSMNGYFDVEPGEHQVTLAHVAEEMATPEAIDEAVEIIEGHQYTMYVLDVNGGDGLHAVVVDETEALEGKDPTTEIVELWILNNPGWPTWSFMTDDEAQFEGLAYGDYRVWARSPKDRWEQIAFVETDDPSEVIWDFPGEGADVPDRPARYVVVIMQGRYKLDTPFWAVNPTLETVFRDGGEVAVGDAVPDEIAVNERVRYTLTLNEETTIHLVASAAEGSELDSMILLYDEAGNLLEWNDDLLQLDAGLRRRVDAGTYVIEVGAFIGSGSDTGGAYELHIGPKQ